MEGQSGLISQFCLCTGAVIYARGATYCMWKSAEVEMEIRTRKKPSSLKEPDSAAQVTSMTTVETRSVSDAYFFV